MDKTFTEKLNGLACLVQAHALLNLATFAACEHNRKATQVRIIPGPKYTKLDIGLPANPTKPDDIGQWSGRFMIENETGRIYGIKAYGKVHKGHYHGTLDEVLDHSNPRWWGCWQQKKGV